MPVVFVSGTCTFEMKGQSVIEGNTQYNDPNNNQLSSLYFGAGVYVEYGTVLLSGDQVKIWHNYRRSQTDGGGLGARSGAQVVMSGANAEISGNQAEWGGGGVSMDDGSTFTMSGTNAAISNNIADTWGGGGGVKLDNGSTFIMSGSASGISGNSCLCYAGSGGDAAGGGVSVENGSVFIMSGSDSEISGNRAVSNSGGGVSLASSSQFTMSGANAKISYNESVRKEGVDENVGGNSGGVRVRDGSVFTMKAGEVSGNRCDPYQTIPLHLHQFGDPGGAIFVWPAGTHGSITGINGLADISVPATNVDQNMTQGGWYDKQLVGTVFRAWVEP
jgi:parallel beta-helix repeat protein